MDTFCVVSSELETNVGLLELLGGEWGGVTGSGFELALKEYG